MRLLLKSNENAHLVYIEDVAAAAIYLLQTSSDKPVVAYVVLCDEEKHVS
jgi:nucleoside-diphosphate-sugar epimerase